MDVLVGTAPAPDTLGYDASIDVGTVAAEQGSTALALTYFERAVTLRRTGYALTKRGKCLRDLGRLEDAAAAYREAMERGDGSFSYARLGLAAVLCDLGEYNEASTLAEKAAREDPPSAALSSVVARCLVECRSSVEPSVDPRLLDEAEIQARDLRAHTQAVEGVTPGERLRERRERTLPHYLVSPGESPAPVVRGASDEEASADNGSEVHRIGLWGRILRALGRDSA